MLLFFQFLKCLVDRRISQVQYFIKAFVSPLVPGKVRLQPVFYTLLVTCGNILEARRIASKLVRKRLAACATIVLGPVQSVYRWKGKVESAREQLLLIKTMEKCIPALEAEIKRLHSYDVPEFLVLPVARASADYLKWLVENSQ